MKVDEKLAIVLQINFYRFDYELYVQAVLVILFYDCK